VKVLVVRFSSIGDIVLCTPVVRCLKEQLPNAEIHFATKSAYGSLLDHNPYIQRVHTLGDDWDEFTSNLKTEKFDRIIDLHNNLRSRRLALDLGLKRSAFDKINIAKWLKVNLKIDRLPKVHIVDRYLETVKDLGVNNDGKGLDVFLPEILDDTPLKRLPEKFICLALGGQHATKKLPQSSMEELLSKVEGTIVLIGGPEDEAIGERLAEIRPGVINLCGKLSLLQSALAINRSSTVITHDTGMMHIAAAFEKNVLSIWGNTIPSFGMTPYKAGPDSTLFEVKGLKCRPCSKIGYDRCPKGHFRCMLDQDLDSIANAASVLSRKEH